MQNENGEVSNHSNHDHNSTLLGQSRSDDPILWILISFCILTPILMICAWLAYGWLFPPFIMAVLLGIGTAALTYRYLGGTAGNEFSVGALKVAGSAAILLGTAWLGNEKFSEEMKSDDKPTTMRESAKTIRDLRAAYLDLSQRFEALQNKYDQETTKLAHQDVDYLESLSSTSEFGSQLVKMAQDRRGPFSEIASENHIKVSITGYVEKGNITACDDQHFDGQDLNLVREPDPDSADQPIVARVRQQSKIDQVRCSSSIRKFDAQIGCADGKSLFPELIATCGKNGLVGWKQRDTPNIVDLIVQVMSPH